MKFFKFYIRNFLNKLILNNLYTRYLYTGHFNMTNKNGIEILNIIVASDDLKLNQIIKVAEDIFIENHQKFN